MVKRILIFAVTFAVALGGATAAVVMRTKPDARVKAADSSAVATRRDSSAAHDSSAKNDSTSVAKDSTPIVGLGAIPLREPVKQIAPAVAAIDTTKVAAPNAPGAAVASATPPSAPVTPVLAGGRLSKIFSAMPAKDAAKVLVAMDDADIKEILGRLNDRKAAEILALLPAPRAALISKAALTIPGTNK